MITKSKKLPLLLLFLNSFISLPLTFPTKKIILPSFFSPMEQSHEQQFTQWTNPTTAVPIREPDAPVSQLSHIGDIIAVIDMFFWLLFNPSLSCSYLVNKMYLLTCSLLDNNNLTGNLPSEFSEMPSLKILYDFLLC